MKKQVKLLLVVVPCAIVAVIAIRAATIWPQSTPKDPALVPTKKISKENSIGGKADAKSKDNTAQNSGPQASPQTPSAPQNQTPATPADLAVDTAPKQTEVKKTISKEYPYYALGTSNDPLTQTSWALTATKAQTAWDRSTGSTSNVVVAVIDTGFALGHEDLVGQWYKNNGEIGQTTSGDRCWTGQPADKASNNCDDDNNGYLDDWRGWDFVSRTNNPQAGRTNAYGDGVAHGTEVAGLVGATGNNAKGIATYSWNTKIMPLQVLTDDGTGYTSSIASAIYYAVDNGAQVINMSLGGPDSDPALDAAIDYAYSKNVVVVAAAGNCGTGTEQNCDPAKPGAMGYPGLNRHVIAVGATTSNNTRASFSSYGPALDVVAPGSGSIASTMWTPTNQTSAYATSLYGTSFSSPLVAGYIALIKSVRPNSSVDDITGIVSGTAQKVPSMGGNIYTNEYGHGLINAQQGLVVSDGLNTASSAPVLLQTGSAQSEHSYTASTLLSSGCTTQASAYCTVWATNTLGYDRYLPYTPTGSIGAGWSWSGSALNNGEWQLYARSGTNVSSTPYILFAK